MRSTDPILAAVLLAAALPALADDATVAGQAVHAPGDIAETFAAFCFAAGPDAVSERAAQAAETAGYQSLSADVGTQMYASADGLVTITVTAAADAATCEAGVSPAGGDFGNALEAETREAVIAHRDGSEPEVDFLQGGVAWTWEQDDTDFRVDVLESPELYLLRYSAEGRG